jgi:uncharacterized protein YlxP (DUF503 family)
MTVYVGVLKAVLHVPGARSLKDSRQVVQSLRDRVRHRFDVSCHEIDPSDHPTRRALIVTTAGNDARLIRSILDRVREQITQQANAIPLTIDVDVAQWHPRNEPDIEPDEE